MILGLFFTNYARGCLFRILSCEWLELDNEMKYLYPALTKLNGVFGVIKPHGITSAETCNQIRHDLVRGIRTCLFETGLCYFHVV